MRLTNEMCIRDSDNIKYNHTLPKVMFTGFQLFNREVEVGEECDGRIILPGTLNHVQEIIDVYKRQI